MKSTFMLLGLLITTAGLLGGCGENSNYNGSCQSGYTWNGSSCVLSNNAYGYATGYNTYTGNTTIPMQGCVAPNVWNGTTCLPQTGMQTINTLPQQVCPAGQYFNGIACATTILYQGSCTNGQINTASYGCVQNISTCESGYGYSGGCVSAPITFSSCKSVKVRRHGRVIVRRNHCPNDLSGNYGTPRKIKLNRDGTIKKIKW